MRMARQVVQRVWGLAFLFVVLGSKAAFAAASGAAEAPAKGGAGTSPILSGNVHEIATRMYALVLQYGLNFVGALAIFFIGRWVAKSVSSLLNKALTKAKVDATLVSFIDNLAYTAMLIFIIIAALAEVGVQTASVVAVLGAAGLAVGLALQGSLANFASGVLLLVFKPFRVGDYVEISGVGGTVQAIHVFNTVLNDPNNIRVIVPNGQVTGGNILNYTINGTRRIDLTASVSYDDDLRKARQVIERVLAAEPRILPDPAPVVAVKEMADSSVDFAVRPWVKADDYWPVYFDLTEKLKTAIEENGMTIPFTTQEIVVKTDAAAAGLLKSA
jgi:small conductance mechanosensitive channel